jgi:hypothetical protein
VSAAALFTPLLAKVTTCAAPIRVASASLEKEDQGQGQGQQKWAGQLVEEEEEEEEEEVCNSVRHLVRVVAACDLWSALRLLVWLARR